MSKNCVWRDDGEGNWETDCGKIFVFVFIDGNPIDNGMRYCCYCGRRLITSQPAKTPIDEPTQEPTAKTWAWRWGLDTNEL